MSWLSSREITTRLRNLRNDVEKEYCTNKAFSFLLFDVCQALELSEGETRAAVGPALFFLIDMPIEDIDPGGDSE